MKKSLLSLFAACCFGLAAQAQTADLIEGRYAGKLYVDLTGQVSEDTPAEDGLKDIYIDEVGLDHISFTLPNFGFMGMKLGNIQLENIPVIADENAPEHLHFGDVADKKFVFHVYDNGQVGEIVATAKINAQKSVYDTQTKALTVFVDVNWLNEGDKTPIGVKFTSESKNPLAYFQVPNSDFERWADKNEPGFGWYSFVSAKAEGFFMKMGQGMSKENTLKAPGYQSESALRLVSKDFGMAKANGNVTTGRINMGSSNPTDAKNFNFTERNGKNHLLFAGLPDSVTCMATYIRGEEGKDYNGCIRVLIHGDIDYKDPHETEANKTNYLVAESNLAITPTTAWQRFSAPLTYTGTQAEKRYALVNITTNPKAGDSAKDTLTVDNLRFIYNSELATATFDGAALELPAAGDTAVVKANYVPEKLQLTSNAHAADITTAYVNATKTLLVTVTGADVRVNPTNVHTYAFRFDPLTGIEEVSTAAPAARRIYDLQGRRVQRPGKGLYIVNGQKVLF